MDAQRLLPARRPLVAHVRTEDARGSRVVEVRRLGVAGAVLDLGDARAAWASLGQTVELAIFEADKREGFGALLRARVVRVVESLEGHEVALAFDIRHPAVRRFVAQLTEPAPGPPPLPRRRPDEAGIALRPPLRVVGERPR